MTEERYKDEEWLEEQFVEKGLTRIEIGDRCGVSGACIGNWVDKYDIQQHIPKYKNEEWLLEQYLEKEREFCDIAQQCNVSDTTIRNWIDEFGLRKEEPWENKEYLVRLYCDEKMTSIEIAEEIGCMQKTVLRWLNKYGVEMRDKWDYVDRPWRNEDEIRDMYVEKNMTVYEIADEFNCSNSAILGSLNEYDIETRSCSDYESDIPILRTHPRGYENVYSNDVGVSIHRLVAISEYGFDEVIGKDVHHKNEIPWDNRPENLEVMTRSEHSSYHSQKQQRYNGHW